MAPEVAAFFTDHHRRRGVRIHAGTFVSAFEPQAEIPSRVGGVLAIDGRRFPADLVIVGVGVVPDSALAEAAGPAVENGIAVDEYCRTSDPHVWAAGDCTSHPSERYQRRVRLESADSAFEQARTAAANVAGRSTCHNRVPWFWSDQYELKLKIIGLNVDYNRALLRGQADGSAFSCCYLEGQELLTDMLATFASGHLISEWRLLKKDYRATDSSRFSRPPHI